MKKAKYEELVPNDKLDTLLTRLQQAQTFRQQTRDNIFKVIDIFYRGQQWSLSGVTDAWKITPNANHIFSKVHTLTSSLAGGDYRGELIPVEEETKDSVLELEQALHLELELMKDKHYIKKAVNDGVKLGIGITHVYYDSREKRGNVKGAINLKHFDPSKVFFDPTALEHDENNMNYMFTVERITLADFMAIKEFSNKEVILKEISDDEEDKNREIEGEYQYSGHGTSLDRGEIYTGRDYETYQDKILVLKTYYERYYDEDNNIKIKVIYFVNNIPVRIIEELPTNCFPFAIYLRYEIPDSPYGLGDAELILENSKIYNKIQALILTHVAMSSTPQQLVNTGSGLNISKFQLERGKFGNVYTVNNIQNAIANVPLPNLPANSIQALEMIKTDMEDIIGVNANYTGESSGSLQSKGAIQKVQERATLRDKERLTNFQTYIERLTELVIKFMFTYYDEERYYVKKTANKEFSFRKIDFSKIKNIPYLFYIDVLEHAPLSEQQMNEEVKWLLTMQGQYGQNEPVPYITQEEVMERIRISKKETILDRMKNDRANLKAVEHDFLLKTVEMASGMGMQKDMAISKAIKLWNGLDPQIKTGLIKKAKSNDGVIARLYNESLTAEIQQGLMGMGESAEQSPITNPNISTQQIQGNVPSPTILENN